MSSGYSLLALQKALYTALTSDPLIQQLIGNPARVFDLVPQGTAYPYVTIGDETAAENDTQTAQGLDVTTVIHSWSQALGRSEVKTLMGHVYRILHEAQLPMTGHQMIVMRQEFSNGGELDPDGVTHHGVQRFRVLTQGV